jgi:hypothetical protein
VSFRATIASSGRWSLISRISSGGRLMKVAVVEAMVVRAFEGNV